MWRGALWRLIFVAGVAGAWSPATRAQTPADEVDTDVTATQPGSDEDGNWEGAALAGRLLRPSEADRGPLRPGEDDELMAFLQQRMPQLYGALSMLRERKPDEFRARLNESAPQLRHIRRVYERYPQIGERIRDHAENMFRLRRVGRMLARGSEGGWRYDRAVEQARKLIRDNLELEIGTLRQLADEFEATRTERVQERYARLIDPGREPTDESEPLRRLIALYRESPAESAERAGIAQKLNVAAGRLVDSEIRSLRQRADTMSASMDEEVERRLERMKQTPPARGDWRPGGPRPDHRRERDEGEKRP